MRNKYICLAILFLQIIFWLRGQIFFGQAFVFMDHTYYFYPLRYFLAQTVRAGSWPLWLPHFDAGIPFLADPQAAVFYPLSIVYYLLPFHFAYQLFVIGHYFLAGGLMFLLGRELKFSATAALISALTFTFSAYLLSVNSMLTTLSAAAWVPLAIIFLRRRNWLAVSISLALIYLGGEPTVLFLTLLVFSSYVLYRDWREFGWWVGTVALFFLLTAVQLIPFLEFSRLSTRVGETFERMTQWSVMPQEFLKFFLPYYVFESARTLATAQWLKTFYLGLLPLLLIPFAWLKRAGKEEKFWLMILLLSCLLCLGRFLPGYKYLMMLVPGLGLIRYPVKFILYAVVAISILAGFGFDNLRVEASGRLIKRYFYFGLILSVILAGWIIFGPRQWYSLANSISLGYSLLFFFLTVLGLSLLHDRRTGVAVIFLLGVFYVDLYTANHDLTFTIPRDKFLAQPRNYEVVSGEKELYRIFTSPAIEQRCRGWSPEESRDFSEAIYYIKERLSPNQTIFSGRHHAFYYGSLLVNRYTRLVNHLLKETQPRDSALLNLLNIKYLTAGAELKAPGFRLVRETREKYRPGESIVLMENLQVLPRAFLVPRAIIVPSTEAAFVRVTSRNFDPRREIVLESAPTAAIRNEGRVFPLQAVKNISYQNNSAEYLVRAPQAAYLFVSDTYYPGWNVFVDGRKGELLLANYTFRAVVVPTGEHRVRFVYDPWSFKLGAGISFLTWSGLLIGFIIWKKRK